MTEHESTNQGRSVDPVRAPSAAEDPFLVCRALTRNFGDVRAVDGVDLSLHAGEFFSLLGPSGCGKTTTLRMIAGFERPDQGSITLGGREIDHLPPNRRPVNTVFQSYALFGHLSVFDNVAFGLRERGTPRARIQNAVNEALELVQLTGYGQRKPRELSGGQQQRVALARAIVNEPDVLLLDEPLGALDLKLRRAMQAELKALQQRLGMAFLYVTHDQEEALAMSDRVAVMQAGKIVQIGSPEDIYDRPASAYVAGFVGEANTLSGTVVSIESDRVVVELSTGALLTGRGNAVEPGQPVLAMIRPEKLLVAPVSAQPESPGSACILEGTVVDQTFVGTYRRYVVTASEQVSVVATAPNRAQERATVARGMPACAWCNENDIWVLPA